MLTILGRYATWRNTILLLAAQFALQAAILFLIYPLIGGQGVPLDMRSRMSVPEIQAYIASLGDKGRIIYGVNEATADIVFPLLYSLAYAFLFLRLLTPMAAETSRWHLSALLPFCIAVADLFENASIIGALMTYGQGAWSRGAVLFNTVKGFFMMVSIAALLVVLCGRLLFFLLGKRKASGPANG